MTEQLPAPDPALGHLTERILDAAASPRPGSYVVAIAGSVGVGKSTFAAQLASSIAAASPTLKVEVVSTDVFLLTNEELEALGGPFVKGYPQSYDWDSLLALLEGVRRGDEDLTVAVYSHERFDVDRDQRHAIGTPDVLIIEGLNVLQVPPRGEDSVAASADTAIYLDVDHQVVEDWFVQRFVHFAESDRDDPDAFYYPFAQMPPDELDSVARWTWNEINLPNLVSHIEPSRRHADFVVRLDSEHRIVALDEPSEHGLARDVEVIEQRYVPADPDAARARREAVLADPEFGAAFSDHMVVMEYTDGSWGPMRLQPYGDLSLSPATLALHYGQSVFEALKAYRQPGRGPVLFRPQVNARRFRRSTARLSMPPLPDGAFELACALLADADRDWIPAQEGAALYLRPFMFASEAHLSVRPAHEFLFVVIASPVAAYFGGDIDAISVHVETSDVRAAPGGTGAVKFAGNYAAGFGAHGRAGAAGHDQVLWLDAAERRWVEELNAMNVMFVWDDPDDPDTPVLTTPPLSGTILEGVTRSSLLQLARDAGLTVREQPTSIEQIRDGVANGSLREVFACGTAAVVVPVGRLVDERVHVVGDGCPGPVTLDLRHRLLGVQQGRTADRHGWCADVDSLLVRP